MPEQPSTSIPLSAVSIPRSGSAQSSSHLQPSSRTASSSDLEHLSKEVSRQSSRRSSPAFIPSDTYRSKEKERLYDPSAGAGLDGREDSSEFEQVEAEGMPSDLRHSMDDNDKYHYNQPLLSEDKSRHSYDSEAAGRRRPDLASRRSSRFRATDLEEAARKATKKRYTYAACFLFISLISFAVQTETAVYIQHDLHWNKAYCML